jgi:hypothetical protein
MPLVGEKTDMHYSTVSWFNRSSALSHNEEVAFGWNENVVVDLASAPGRIRTCAPGSGGQCSIP